MYTGGADPALAAGELVRSLPVIMHGVDKSGNLIFVSRKWQSMMGYRQDEVVGRPLTDFLDEPSRRRALDESLPQFFKVGIVEDLRLTMITKSGDARHVLLSAFAEYDSDGVFVRSIAVLADITQQENDSERLRQSERQFRASFQTAPHGMALVSTDGRWLAVNTKVCEIIGYDEEELLRTDFQTITHPEDLESDLELLGKVLADEIQTYQMEKRYFRKDGSIVPILLSVSLVRDSRGDPVHFVSQIQDLSQQKQAEEKLIRAQKLEAVGQLTGGIAHDFNNLLTVIGGNLQLLQRGLHDDEKVRRRWKAAVDACDRGAELTRRLLAFSRRQSLEPERICPAELVRDMQEMLHRTLGENIELSVSVSEYISDIRADRSQLESAILNLAINARDAMRDGGSLTIETELVQVDENETLLQGEAMQGNFVRIAVSDTGTGIPEEVVNHVFEPFYSTKGSDGSGLGLSMVHGFVNQSGGQIRIYSELGLGTTVSLYLPLANDADSFVPNQTKETQGPVAGGTETILVVEDQDAVREVTVSVLLELGYRVVEAVDGDKGLKMLESGIDVDLLFTDVVMPGELNGFELASAARSLRPDLRIGITTGFAKSLITKTEMGVSNTDAILTKPYRPEELARFVRGVLDETRERHD